ncbi:MAG: EAL domain-containing protein [Rhodospirillaceae bacterium]|nr:EAL domain-containing protein [Rhodospirillales bacterium]
MMFSAPSVVHGALIGTIVLVAAMAFVGRSPAAPRGLTLFAIAFALHVTRYLLLLSMPLLGGPLALVLAEASHAGSGVVMLAATAMELRRPPPRRTLFALWVGMVAALAVGLPLVGEIATAPISLFVGAVMMAAAAAFWLRARKAPGAGYRAVAVLLALWGLHKWDAPWLMQVEWLRPYGFMVSEVLAIGLGVALLLASDRERRYAEMEARRRSEGLLRLQGEAMEATANAIFITDRAGRIEWSNAAFTRLSGWTGEEARKRGARRLLMGGERDRRFQDALEQGRVWRGELSLRRKDGTLYIVDQTVTPIADDKGRVAHYVVVQEDVTERRQAEERIRFLSNHDALTALPNRLLFREHLQRAIARAKAERSSLGVLFLDLDDFSHYNDVLGHDGGDRLLLQLVERLMSAARGVETLGRVGGDEFAVVLTGGGEAAAEMAQTLLAAVAQPFDLDGHEVQLGASVGIALFPLDGGDAETLMKNADVAMYRAIHEVSNGYRFFAPAMDAELAARRRMEGDLRRAAIRGELVLHYQPIVRVNDRRIIGFEALVRWNHPEDGLIPPGEFIPLAEENGLIGPIGEWVLIEACRQAALWIKDGLPPVPIAVNLSAVQMKRQDLPMLVRRILAEAGLPPGRLELELTETAMMDDPEAAGRVLADIEAMGMGLAVDDFGTGYSSLGRLKRFPVCKLKIDRSFVSELAENQSDRAIARAIVSLAHALELTVVAEGVETEAQFAILAAEGCDSVQGYLFSPGVPAEQAAELLRKGGF